VNSADRSTIRVSRLLIVDIPAVLVLALLIVYRVIPLYPSAPIAYLLLIAINVLLARTRGFQRVHVPEKRGAIPVSLWIVAAVFTPAGIVAIIAYVRKPNMPLGVQAVIAVLLVGYIWFLVYRFRRNTDSRNS
jgi:hypothetical protein